MPTKQKNRSIIHRVGLDIGSHSVKGVEVFERGPEIVIRSAGLVPIPEIKSKADSPDHGSVVQAVKTLWAKAGFATRAVVLALPAESVYIKWLHLEASNPDELDVTARAAAVRGAPFPADEAIVDYRVMTSHGRAVRNVHFVMLVAASATAVDSLLDIAESAGLEPIAVDIGTVAALRSFEAQKKSSSTLWSGQPLAHCILGAKSTTITVVRGGEPEFARTVPVGGNDFTERIAEHLSVTWQEAEKIKVSPGTRLLESGTMVTSHDGQEVRIQCDNVVARMAREIRRSLRFFTSQYAEGSYLGMIGSTTIGGGAALMRGLDTCLEQQGIEINGAVNPFAGFSVEAEGSLQIGDSSPQFETAMGLAIADYTSNASVQMEMDFAA